MSVKKKKHPQADKAAQNYYLAVAVLRKHPLFSELIARVAFNRKEKNCCPDDGWAVAFKNGGIHVHPTRLANPDEWVYVLAHCLLHYGMGHVKHEPLSAEWVAACDIVVTRFLANLKLGRPPLGYPLVSEFGSADEHNLYERFLQQGIPAHADHYGTAGKQLDMSSGIDISEPLFLQKRRAKFDWERYFALGLVEAVTSAVNVANGLESSLGDASHKKSSAERAREWFINRYPLLGALASAFKIIEDTRLCHRLNISVAAVDASNREIYINPSSVLTDEELRFVMAHELLHVGLRHETRAQGRDAYLWNVACDYVVNGWLVEMQVGCIPAQGLLYDPKLNGFSAETIYDIVVHDVRRFRKLATLRGIGLGDILGHGEAEWWKTAEGMTLDEFYRNCLGQGLVYSQSECRGYLPVGLIEEIQALNQPPIPWDVELARWFEQHFHPIDKIRSYARPSRRQASTPNIPRPCWVAPEQLEKTRTFGVVLDTSGSMDKKLLAKALGAIASYAIAKDVLHVRLIFCDAAPYDAGYLPPEAIAEKVQVKGRGGTVLQPAIDLLQMAEDFPPRGPILIITDGYCERLHVKRDHAFLMPKGHTLPFPTKGPVFSVN